MNENVKKLTLIGLGIMLTSFLILSHAKAQTSDTAPSLSIRSLQDFVFVEKTIEGLAAELHEINQSFPDFKYVHHYDKKGKLIGVTVLGLDDSSQAVKTAFCILKLEMLGDLMRNVDENYIPEDPMDHNVKPKHPNGDRKNLPAKDGKKPVEQIIYPENVNLL